MLSGVIAFSARCMPHRCSRFSGAAAARTQAKPVASIAMRSRSAAPRRVVDAGARHHDDELLAAIARERIEHPGIAAQRLGDRPQRVVARRRGRTRR